MTQTKCNRAEKDTMQLTRKSFLHALAALSTAPLATGGGETLGSGLPRQVVPEIPLPPEPELSLREWQAAGRTPILNSEEPVERFFIRALRLNQSVDFTYAGGSSFGAQRRVHPVLLYRVEGYPASYVTGFCELRQEIRTFRLDRVQLQPAAPASVQV